MYYQLYYNQYSDFSIPGKDYPSKKLFGEEGKKYEKVLEDLFDKVVESALENYNVILIVALTDNSKIINKLFRSLNNVDDNLGDFFRFVHVGMTNKDISDDYDDYRGYYRFFYSPISQVFDAFYEYRINFTAYEVTDKISQYVLPTTEEVVEISEQLRNQLARNFDEPPVSEKANRGGKPHGDEQQNIFDEVRPLNEKERRKKRGGASETPEQTMIHPKEQVGTDGSL